MSPIEAAFVPLISCSRGENRQTQPDRCRKCNSTLHSQPSRTTRRLMLSRSLIAVGSLMLGSSSFSSKAAADDPKGENGPICKNCAGIGKIPCDLCSGTGFWRALSGSDPKQKYKGVVCPECEGSGTLTCPICLGTGEGNVKGLLRRRRIEPGPGRVLQSN